MEKLIDIPADQFAFIEIHRAAEQPHYKLSGCQATKPGCLQNTGYGRLATRPETEERIVLFKRIHVRRLKVQNLRGSEHTGRAEGTRQNVLCCVAGCCEKSPLGVGERRKQTFVE